MTHFLVDMINKRNNDKNLHEQFNVGDTVKVYYKVKEGDKERVQIFEGVVTARKASTFVVRKISYEVGIERTFPYSSPFISKVETVRRGKVRRAKLYYLRDKIGKHARIKELKKPKVEVSSKETKE